MRNCFAIILSTLDQTKGRKREENYSVGLLVGGEGGERARGGADGEREDEGEGQREREKLA